MIDPRLLQVVGDFLMGQANVSRPLILGLAGSQGSGKSTLGAELARLYGGVCLSLDDVYLTKSERRSLARTHHPLLKTRGVPGTHDLGLMNKVLDGLLSACECTQTALPVFDKRSDDRLPQRLWRRFEGRPALIIIEGWCLGCLPQPSEAMDEAVNEFEARYDCDGAWRQSVNRALTCDGYSDLRNRLDALIYLAAPDFDVVLDWRCQQEAGLVEQTGLSAERRLELAHFVDHFERLTRWMLDGHVDADLVIHIDGDRRFSHSVQR